MREVRLPRTLSELWSDLDARPSAVVFAGGTDLFVGERFRANVAPLVGLERIAELKGVWEEGGEIGIGACTTHEELLRHPSIHEHLPVLHAALRTIGSPPIRTMGTIGGNVCTASPAGDTLPPLYVLRAEIELASANGRRRVAIQEFIVGPGRTRLERGEVVAAIRVKKPCEFNTQHFEKVGQRKSMACAVASIAALLMVSPSGTIEAARLAWGSVGPTVIADAALDGSLVGRGLNLETLGAVAEQVARRLAPIDDIRASAAYRRTVSANLLLRLLHAR